MTHAEVRTTEVDLSGLMTVLGDHLYSTPTVALRELVQNAHDSCTRRRIEAPGDDFTPTIHVKLDGENHVVAVEDNGAGLTHDEVIRYLATVGSGYTKRLRQETGDESLIGMFGLGFLSAFVVSERTHVFTVSYQAKAEGWHYQSRTGESYTLEPAQSGVVERGVGTRVELHLKPKFHALAKHDALKPILERYAALLPIEVWLDGERINAEPPPWREEESNPARLHKKRLAFATRFERRFEPICALPINATEGTDARGLLWVQDGATYGTSDNRNLAVFVRGMLLDDDARELLPAWAGFMGGVLESAQLTPTASREDLQRDDGFRATHRALTESLIHGLSDIARAQPEAWRRVLSRHNEALLGAAICDERLFKLLADELTLPTSEGDLSARAILRRTEREGGKRAVHVTLSRRGGFEEMLFRALQVPIVAGTRYGALAFAEKYCDVHGGNVVQLGTHKGDRQIFRRAELDAASRAYLSEHLARAGQELIAARFSPKEVPLVVVPDREAEMKQRLESDEADKRIAAGALGLARLYTKTIAERASAHLYVNLDSPAIIALLAAKESARDVGPAVKLLRALGALMTGAGEGAGRVDLLGTLGDYGDAVCALLGETR
jgi:molecular chaperone HtpG